MATELKKKVPEASSSTDEASVRLAFDLRNTIKGCHWSYQNQILEMLEWICPTDRIHEKARGRALKLINDQERAMVAIIDRQVKGTKS